MAHVEACPIREVVSRLCKTVSIQLGRHAACSHVDFSMISLKVAPSPSEFWIGWKWSIPVCSFGSIGLPPLWFLNIFHVFRHLWDSSRSGDQQKHEKSIVPATDSTEVARTLDHPGLFECCAMVSVTAFSPVRLLEAPCIQLQHFWAAHGCRTNAAAVSYLAVFLAVFLVWTVYQMSLGGIYISSIIVA